MMTSRETISALIAAMNASVIGQERVVERMVIGLLADGHVLLEGLPGLAKTRAVKAMARALDARFSRVQFTPDLLPADVTGSEIYYSEGGKGAFRFQQGPIFGNILLADEINRAPAKVQSALLEAMEERQVTVGGTSHRLPAPFMVLATQNPIEQEGTYPLPEAQTDRFLMKVLVDYPAPQDEIAVLRMVRAEEQAAIAPQGGAGDGPSGGPAGREAGGTAGAANPGDAPSAPAAASRTAPAAAMPGRIPLATVFAARAEIGALHVAPEIERYIIDIVNATRQPGKLSPDLGRLIDLGASPRAGIALDRCGRAHAWLKGQDFVSPGDIQAVAPDVLRHRLALSYEARGAGRSADDVVAELMTLVAVA